MQKDKKKNKQLTQEVRVELFSACVSEKNSLGLSAARTSGTFWSLAPRTGCSTNSRGGLSFFKALRGINIDHPGEPGVNKNTTL